MPRKARSIPKYCLHKQSGQARVIIAGHHHMLGEYGTPESHLPRAQRYLMKYLLKGATTSPSQASSRLAPRSASGLMMRGSAWGRLHLNSQFAP